MRFIKMKARKRYDKVIILGFTQKNEEIAPTSGFQAPTTLLQYVILPQNIHKWKVLGPQLMFLAIQHLY
jgi:hypothetical protein